MQIDSTLALLPAVDHRLKRLVDICVHDLEAPRLSWGKSNGRAHGPPAQQVTAGVEQCIRQTIWLKWRLLGRKLHDDFIAGDADESLE